MSGEKKQPKSIFDEKFEYLKMPIEVLKIPKLRFAEKGILSRIVFWTRKGMPCTHTNAQFAELTGQTERNAGRAVANLLKRGLADAIYRNNRKLKQKNCYRELTALVGVRPDMVLKRKAAQVARKLKAEKKASGQNRLSTTTHKTGHQDKMSTSSGQNVQLHQDKKNQALLTTTKKQLTPPSPASAGQTSAAERQQLRDDHSAYILEASEETLIDMHRRNIYGYRWLIDELKPEIQAKAEGKELQGVTVGVK